MEVISLYISIVYNTIDIKYGHDTISKECSICMTNIATDKSIVLPCKHSFHSNCIDRWFKENNTCCLCRSKVKHTTSIVHEQKVEKKKLRFLKRLLRLISLMSDVISVVDNITYPGFKMITLMWEDIELIRFSINTTGEYKDICYNIIDKPLLKLLWHDHMGKH